MLADARRRAGLTQAELAARLGMSQSGVAKLEREDANPTVRTLERALRAIGRRLEMRAALPNIDESLIRQDLALTPAERILRLEREAAEIGQIVAAGARARGERV
jgi:transcriptional regulator with XRE-family HTH domain